MQIQAGAPGAGTGGSTLCRHRRDHLVQVQAGAPDDNTAGVPVAVQVGAHGADTCRST